MEQRITVEIAATPERAWEVLTDVEPWSEALPGGGTRVTLAVEQGGSRVGDGSVLPRAVASIRGLVDEHSTGLWMADTGL